MYFVLLKVWQCEVKTTLLQCFLLPRYTTYMYFYEIVKIFYVLCSLDFKGVKRGPIHYYAEVDL